MSKEKKLDSKITIKGDTLIVHNKFPIRIGFLPDIHAGSSRSVAVPRFEWKDAGGLPQITLANEVQLMLYKLWQRNIQLFKKYNVQHIFVVGDAFQGSNYFERGAFSKVEQSRQIKLATDLLWEVYEGCDKKVDFFVWRGTKYHESPAGLGEMHEGLVQGLNARAGKTIARFMYQISYIEIHGGKDTLTGKNRVRRLLIAHEAPSALVYPATLMSRDINWALQAEASGQALPVDAIIRAHLHTWLHVDHHGVHAVQLPCWQGHVPYKATIKYFFKLQPTLGGAMMLMDEYGRLQFWGGSYPFGFTRENRLKLHRLCTTLGRIEPNKRLSKYGVHRKRLSSK